MFYAAAAAVRNRLEKEIANVFAAGRVKNPLLTNEGFLIFSIRGYNSNNKVKETLLLIELILAPSVNPWLRKPCCEFLSEDE